MVYSKIELPPGSAEEISFTIRDRNKKPIDFGLGFWSARLVIVRYPGSSELAFHSTGTSNVTGTDSNWLELKSETDDSSTVINSSLIMTPDPLVTADWKFSRYHYNCYVNGPSISSPPVLLAHGPFIMDL